MKRYLKLVSCVVMSSCLFLGLLPGCGAKQNTDGSMKMRVGTQPSAVGVPVQYALDNGFFKEEGLEVDLQLFPTGAPINEAIAANNIDLAANGLASVFTLANGLCDWIGEGNSAGGMGI